MEPRMTFGLDAQTHPRQGDGPERVPLAVARVLRTVRATPGSPPPRFRASPRPRRVLPRLTTSAKPPLRSHPVLLRSASRDWRDAVSDDDEAVLCSFQYELERGIERFEAAKAAGTLDEWPPGTLHPTTGLPAVAGAFRAAVADACGGRKELFVGIDG